MFINVCVFLSFLSLLFENKNKNDPAVSFKVAALLSELLAKNNASFLSSGGGTDGVRVTGELLGGADSMEQVFVLGAHFSQTLHHVFIFGEEEMTVTEAAGVGQVVALDHSQFDAWRLKIILSDQQRASRG